MIDTSIFNKKKVKFHTLGCKLNFSESSAIGMALHEVGFVNASKGEEADLLVINTCSVTELADKKCRNAIRSEIKKNPHAYVVVTGCYAQLKPEDISHIEGVDLVLGSNEKYKLLDFVDHIEKEEHASIHVSQLKDIKSFYPSFSGSDRTRCFLKIQDGCDYFCSYCTIPFARGASRCSSIEETLKVAQKAISDGAKEIILTGVNVGDFGKGHAESFYELLQAFDAIKEDVRFRIGSVEPNLLTNQIIELISTSEHIMPHFHIPLQSGSDEVLKLMRRRYDTRLFSDKIRYIKELMPEAFIGIDVIVGVNGESEAFFQKAHSFIENLDFSQLHVFSYSERPGTKAIDIEPKVTPQEKKARSQKLLLLSEKKLHAFSQSQKGKTARVLFEKQKTNDMMFGFTENYIKVYAPYKFERVNTFTNVLLEDYHQDHKAVHCQII